MSSLFGWLYSEEQCLMWFSGIYMLLRLFVKINASMFRDLVCSIAKSNAKSSTWRIFRYPMSFIAM